VLTELHRRLADGEQRLTGEVERASGLASETAQVRHAPRHVLAGEAVTGARVGLLLCGTCPLSLVLLPVLTVSDASQGIGNVASCVRMRSAAL
jgi:hypothetical protein